MVRPKIGRALTEYLDRVRKQKVKRDENESGNPGNGRFSSGQRAFIEIRYYTHSTNLQIPHRAAQRIVKEVCMKISAERYEQWQRGRVMYIDNWEPPEMYRMEVEALACLHEAMEGLIVAMMEEMNYAAIHARRVTIMPKDLKLVASITGTNAYQGYGLHLAQGTGKARKRREGGEEPPEPPEPAETEAEVPKERTKKTQRKTGKRRTRCGSS